MKILPLALSSLVVLRVTIMAAPQAPLPADAGLPTPVPATRYATLAKVSLFAPPTAAAVATPPPPPPPQPTWAEAWRLTSLAEIGANRYRLALTRSRPTNDNKALDRVVVTSNENNSEGISLAGVQWSTQPGQTRVTLNRGGVFAVFNFDPSNLQSSPQGVSPNPFSPSRPGGISAPAMQQSLQQQPMNGGALPQVPQRAGTRTGPIPGAPPGPPMPPPRAFQPQTNPGVIPNPAPGRADDEDDQ